MQSIDTVMISQFEECYKIIRFFLSKVVSPDFFNEIQGKLLKDGQKDTFQGRVKVGLFSLYEFGLFYGAYNSIIANIVLKRMVENLFLIPVNHLMISGNQYYQINEKYVTAINAMGIIENQIFGFQYIMKKYRNSVFKIENIAQNGDKDIGTGYLIQINNKLLIITNEHVVANHKELRLLTVNEKEIPFELIYKNENKDLAFLQIQIGDEMKAAFLQEFIPFGLKPTLEPLQRIITIGYPSIPLSKEAYQVYHQGEINSEIEDYKGNKLFLISAKTSSGNSGSPVIDSTGLVLGTITRELFDKGALEEKGKLPYYAVIPTIELTKCITEL